MTIDEVIARERKSAKSNREAEALFLHDDFIWNAKEERKFAEEHEQLAEWLEELKEARKGFEENRKAGYSHGYADGYAKAVDEFVKEIEAEYDNDGCPNVADYLDYKISIRDLFRIAEQLKGVRNERDII